MKIVKTKDNSNTLFSDIYKEHYHSIYGAKNESNHIFIDAGLKQIDKKNISIFEMGFGTGLNAFLTMLEAQKKNFNIEYLSLEKHPVPSSVWGNLGYADPIYQDFFKQLHQVEWEERQFINSQFYLTKIKTSIVGYRHKQTYDLVYYDAFSPDIQPELWSEAIFKDLYQNMNNGGILMTYTVKGVVKRALKSVGFRIEKLSGPIGKREILRAVKFV